MMRPIHVLFAFLSLIPATVGFGQEIRIGTEVKVKHQPEGGAAFMRESQTTINAEIGKTYTLIDVREDGGEEGAKNGEDLLVQVTPEEAGQGLYKLKYLIRFGHMGTTLQKEAALVLVGGDDTAFELKEARTKVRIWAKVK